MEYTHSINDVMEFAAIKTGIDGWRAYKWERMCGGDLVTGCAPDGEYKSGPRKGRPRFSKPLPGTRQQVPVTNAELNAHAARYEREECKCWSCKGSGEEFAGWSKDAGTRKRTCQSCGGTGAPPNARNQRPA